MVTEKIDANELINNVIQWGRDKGIDNPYTQFAKVVEELGECAHELTRGNLKTSEMEDALGDTAVTLIILADILGYSIVNCLDEAYGVISKRTGKTVNGNFVKDN